MPARAPRRWWRICGCCLRGVRNGVLLLVACLLIAGLYVNQIGLPGFFKRPLLDRLRARGVDLQFSRLRVRWTRGLVAENVRFGSAQPDATIPQLTIREAQLKLNHAALANFRLEIDALLLRGGRLVWRLAEEGRPEEVLSVGDIQTQLRFLPDDRWELDHFSAAFAGVKLDLSGSLTNASLARDWKIFHGAKEAQPELTLRQLRALARTIREIKFREPPELKVIFHGDARNVESFDAALTLNAPGSETPWGSLTKGSLLARLVPPDATNPRSRIKLELRADQAVTRWGNLTNGVLNLRVAAPDSTNTPPHAEFELRADGAWTPWAGAKHFEMGLHAVTDQSLTNQVRARLEIRAEQVVTGWAQASNAWFSADWTHSFTNAVPVTGTGELRLGSVRTRWGTVGELRLETRLATAAANRPVQANPDWGWWARLEPYLLDWNCRLAGIRAEDFELKELVCGGLWGAPELVVTNLHAELYQGQFTAHAKMNVSARALTFDANSDFDAQKAAPFLNAEGRRWLQQFSWEKPPAARAVGSVILPAWTSRNWDWHNEVLPSLSLNGDFKVGNAACRGVPVTSARSHFSYTNMVWELPDLTATRPEGTIKLVHESDDRTRDYLFRVQCDVDVKALRPLLKPNAQRGMDAFVFTQPPRIDAEIRGRWRELERTTVKARVAITNFTFRGESADNFQAAMDYTNQFLLLTDARLERGTQYLTASGVGVDFSAQKLYLTNGFSTMEPAAVLHAIGPRVAKTMEPYHFLKPPTVRANGVIPLENEVAPDVHFKVDGGPFQWMKFNLEHVSAQADWVGDRLNLNEVAAEFYQGKITGAAAFDFSHAQGTQFSFDTIVTDTSLQALVAGLFNPGNHLEGRLNGHLNVTRANAFDWQSWFGNGRLELRDGLIWEIPIFGVFSPVFDSISPGLGESRASAGAGNFAITNSVIFSDDLQIRSPVFRMLYRGTVDFDGKVAAKVDAELLKDLPVFGRVISFLFSPLSKLFEFKLTGTLSHPSTEPLYVAKAVSMLFHPFRTLKELLPGAPGNTTTNAPPLPKTP